jgi:hypothetical protein
MEGVEFAFELVSPIFGLSMPVYYSCTYAVIVCYIKRNKINNENIPTHSSHSTSISGIDLMTLIEPKIVLRAFSR